MRLDVICVGDRLLTVPASHIGAAGSQAARAFCTIAASALGSGHLALAVGSVQMNTTPKECVHHGLSNSKTLENNDNCPHPLNVRTRIALCH